MDATIIPLYFMAPGCFTPVLSRGNAWRLVWLDRSLFARLNRRFNETVLGIYHEHQAHTCLSVFDQVLANVSTAISMALVQYRYIINLRLLPFIIFRVAEIHLER